MVSFLISLLLALFIVAHVDGQNGPSAAKAGSFTPPPPYNLIYSYYGTTGTSTTNYYPDAIPGLGSAWFVNVYDEGAVCEFPYMTKQIITVNARGDQAAICGCSSDNQCPYGQSCAAPTSCWCSSNSQCPSGFICVSFPSPNNQTFNYRQSPTGNIGKCIADVRQGRAACNFHGTPIVPFTFNLNFYTQTVETPYQVQAAFAFCHCDDITDWNGRNCGTDVLSSTRCNGQGTAICGLDQIFAGHRGFNPVFSLNDDSEIGSTCPYSLYPSTTVDRVNTNNKCQCANSYSIDTPVYNQGNGVLITPGCSIAPVCGVSTAIGAIGLVRLVNGSYATLCQCKADFYTNPSSGSSCLAGCRVNVCSGHGTCLPSTLNGFNTQCQCDAGFDSFPQRSANLGFYNGGVFCGAPVVNGQLCGERGFIAGAQTCLCTADRNHDCLESLSNLQVQICPSGPATFWPNQPELLCSGPERGSCVSDNAMGHACVCANGYGGDACQFELCPVGRYGMVCSGQPCDSISGQCVCSTPLLGLACEIRDHNCNSYEPKGQSVY